MKYYHGTSYSNFLKIIEDGKIKTSMEGIVYLAKTKEDAFKFVALRYMTEDIAVIELELDNSKIEETFDHSPIFFKAEAYGYPEDISTDCATNCWKYPIEERYNK